MLDDLSRQDARIPVTILSGFLGAGKSTLLNRILRADHGLRIAVLVNDFGSIAIDADLIVDVDGEVLSLINGCFCCTLRDDMVEAVSRAAARPERPDYVLLEASGVAQPSGIALAFTRPSVQDRIRVDGIVCVVDAEQVFTHPELMELKMWQVGCADLVIANKIDLVDASQLARVREWLTVANPMVIEAVRCDVPLELVLAAGRFDSTRLTPHHQPNVFATCSFQTDRPLSLSRLRRELSQMPRSVYRAKGFVYATEEPARRVVVHVVGQRVDISLDEWSDRPRQTQLVFIGRAGDLMPEALLDRLEACVV